MRIHAICLVKNDIDIVRYCVHSALDWADNIYVYDNGSEDGTWEAVQSIASDRIIPWKSEYKPFCEGLRSEPFNAFRGQAVEGDWWCRLDADEFYTIKNPREFLKKVPASFHVVWGTMVEYYLTNKDVDSLNFELPIEELLQKITSYKAAFSEPRFFRHRRRLQWDITGSWPRHVGVVYPERLPYRHFKYRSPQQIQLRLDTRKKAIADGFEGWGSVRVDSWQDKIVADGNLHIDSGTDELVIDEKELPNHLPPLWKRLTQMLLHQTRIWP